MHTKGFAQTVIMMSCLRIHRRWAVSAMQRSCCYLAVGLTVLVAGCGKGPQAEFSLREETTDLIPEAQKVVKTTLKEKFGSPHELIAWQRFPVNYGGVKGSVTEVAAEGKSVVVEWDGDATQVAKDAPLIWVSGARTGEKTSVGSVATYDAAKKELTWTGGSDPAPVAGDKLVIGFGKSLQTGRAVYMKNCMHCHGVSGDGNGPTAQYLNPLPRDYRSGVFKFTSTLGPEKPTRDDLNRVIKYGIPGTYMPSFLWLGDKETESVIEYIRWLAIRGEFESRVDNDLAGDFSQKTIEAAAAKAKANYDAAKGKEKPEKPQSAAAAKSAAKDKFAEYLKTDVPELIDGSAKFIAEAWAHSEEVESLIVPSVARVTDDAASRERGRRLYLSDKGKCYTCHGIQGRGDGAATEDFWKKPGSEEYYTKRGLHDTWGKPLQPRNLTLGQYRGGRRPVDVFRRIYAGIKGTPMPGFGRTALKDEEIWDVVNFVMSLQYESTPTKAKAAEHVVHSK